jgi:hypothetical protein
MPLFNKQEHELKSRYDKWLFFLKNLENFDHIPAILNEPIFEKAFNTLEEANLTPDQLEQYQKSLLTYWELKGVVDTARDEGEAKGLEKGRAEGKASLLDMLLKSKFGTLGVEDKKRLENLNDAQLEMISNKLWTVQSVEELFKAL